MASQDLATLLLSNGIYTTSACSEKPGMIFDEHDDSVAVSCSIEPNGVINLRRSHVFEIYLHVLEGL
ncbi:hypothetical protein T11_1796 [Trichinella zimbabwensis]|uniref:Uncharacterized protein n=1 Tax=Trichinella zimbabwensis TaxID=268475 RepID=A0A0V1GUQ3_9BILA|nr:hypothetical protein T11_2427 [Trichinella zimbabwensis]KRZ01797.1 hypothetical protein T11_1796 [Trichinella zimbabwensis]